MRFEYFLWKGFGWLLKKLNITYLNINKSDPLQESLFIKLSKKVSDCMKRLINIHDNDIECLKWCHVR